MEPKPIKDENAMLRRSQDRPLDPPKVMAAFKKILRSKGVVIPKSLEPEPQKETNADTPLPPTNQAIPNEAQQNLF